MNFGKHIFSLVMAGLLATGVTANTCPVDSAPAVSYGSYSDNPQCHSGGDVNPFGYNYGWKMAGCQPGSFPLTQVAAGTGSEIKGSCPTASDIVLLVDCVGNAAYISWTGSGANGAVLDIKVKGANGGNLFDGTAPSANGGILYGAPSNNGGNFPEISHIEICLNCPVCPTNPPPTDPITNPPPTDPITNPPPTDPITNPPPTGVDGDPHVKSWTGEHFIYMGECDLKLMSVPKFDGEQDIDVHARTTIRYDYSYIETAAIRIGSDTLEVSSWGEYALNGVDNAIFNQQPALRKGNKLNTLGGYEIFHTQMSKKKHVFDVILGPNENITISNMKDIVAVRINHKTNDHFMNVEGLMGHINGGMLARDGVTDLHDDINAMAQEWQIRDDEPMLFRSVREPQYPAKCRLPDIQEKESRRLSEGITEEVAKAACAHLKADAQAFADCVYDVTATNDLDMAQAGVM
ncbi:expressed unknown protein [Seminavis robusta]|uniref:VWFD domain-containing protein n=1 Tax=Seminavis robusta TaxID=568900 RepID=A0A9N8HF68_9STRA|nr:expressed unknown protein [Seminavis robusta]|eukprot:Sro442_g143860.1 n/a (462) ;mRNA; r:21024-22490